LGRTIGKPLARALDFLTLAAACPSARHDGCGMRQRNVPGDALSGYWSLLHAPILFAPTAASYTPKLVTNLGHPCVTVFRQLNAMYPRMPLTSLGWRSNRGYRCCCCVERSADVTMEGHAPSRPSRVGNAGATSASLRSLSLAGPTDCQGHLDTTPPLGSPFGPLRISERFRTRWGTCR